MLKLNLRVISMTFRISTAILVAAFLLPACQSSSNAKQSRRVSKGESAGEGLQVDDKGKGKGEGDALPGAAGDALPTGVGEQGGGVIVTSDVVTVVEATGGKPTGGKPTGGADDGDEDGKPVGDDDNVGKPNQNPNQNPNPGQLGPDDVIDEPDVVVEIPLGACVYLDESKPEFTIAKDQFGPALPPIAVPSRLIAGDLQADGSTYIGFFKLYQRQAEWMLEWDGRAGRIPHEYTLVVVGGRDENCTAYLRHVEQEPRTLNGCFDQNTRLRMADGKDMVIAAISAGDLVWNPATKKPAKVVEVVKGLEHKAMYEIGFAGKKVLVTDTHPMPVASGLKRADQVTTADYLYDENGVIHRVTLVEKAKDTGKELVVNVRLEGSGSNADHFVLADGVVAGDLHLQRKLAGAKVAATK
jgi:hypothetical protein